MNQVAARHRASRNGQLPVGRVMAAAAIGVALVVCALIGTGCSTKPGDRLERRGQEMMVCGQLFHVGAPVVLWTDPGGYDAYRVERRFVAFEESGWEATSKAGVKEPTRYNLRFQREASAAYTPEELEKVRGGGWDLELLREKVDQFVMHYDVCGTSRTCFRVLHDMRGLSVHFMLDVDGTIYQTLDLKERAWHATIANDRSIGIEIANMGAAPVPETWPGMPGKDSAAPAGGFEFSLLPKPLNEWYGPDEAGRTVMTIPARLAGGGVRTPGFVGRPSRNGPVVGEIHGSRYLQFDLTPEQYRSLAKLLAAVNRVLPKVRLEAPRDGAGNVLTRTLTPEEFASFGGVLGHYHIQENKIDPGPAFRWDDLLREARRCR